MQDYVESKLVESRQELSRSEAVVEGLQEELR
jgi:hypothetical protein